MDTKCTIKLYTRFLTFDFFNTRSTDGENITIRIPLDVLDEHPSVNKDWRVVCHVAHELHAATLISDAQLRRLFILVLVAEALSIGVIPLYGCEWHLLTLKSTQTMDSDWELEVSNIVIDVDCAFGCSKQDSSTIRRPFYQLEPDL